MARAQRPQGPWLELLSGLERRLFAKDKIKQTLALSGGHEVQRFGCPVAAEGHHRTPKRFGRCHAKRLQRHRVW